MATGDEVSLERARNWIREKDAGVRLIAAEMAEYAGRVNFLWGQAIGRLDSDPADALAKLTDMEILLENHIRLEREDILAVVTEGLEQLAAALPDDDAESVPARG